MNEKAGDGMLLRKLMFSISALEDLGRVLSSADELGARLRTLLSGIMGSLPVARGGLFLYLPEGLAGGRLELAAVRGVDLAPGLAIPVPTPIRDTLAATGQATFRRAAAEPLQAWLDDFRVLFDGLQTDLLQPLLFKGEFLGVICLGPKFSGEEYRPDDLELLRIMAGYSAIGLHNHFLVSDLERVNRELRDKVSENRRLLHDQQAMYNDMVRALGAAIDAKDSYTLGHSDRVARYAVSIARAMELDDEQIEALRMAGYLHDIGKIAVDSAILCKPRKLNADETRIVTRHPQVSYDILANIRFPYRDVALLARHHHERVNGSGYPDGRRGNDLTPGMKILSLADAFDAMTSDRPYRPALPLEKVLSEIASWVDVQFDRQVTSAFLTTLRKEASAEEGIPADGVLAGLGVTWKQEALNPVIDRLLATIH